ncbi:MAG: hypothetical protein DWQ02_09365 [Bacteroidetes bacterium]|nr:MAG: hypothetical protein DWQ02_09365 [Bacteroidota bacterium]
MNDHIKQFLESGLLEEYVLGVIDSAEIEKVEQFIRDYPEVKAVYEELQENLELLAQKMATTPPPGTKEAILEKIDDEIAGKSTSSSSGTPTWAFAAVIAAIALGVWAIMLLQQKNDLSNQVETLREEYATLQEDCEDKDRIYAAQQEMWDLIGDPNTARFLLTGNDKAPGLEVIAYWNNEEQKSYLNLLSLPQPPEGKCYQLWADIDKEMISIDVLPKDAGQIVAIPHKLNAASLNITIEPDGGNDHATVEELVASVVI